MSSEAAESERTTNESGTGFAASSPDISVPSQHEFEAEGSSIERLQNEAFEAVGVNPLEPQPSPSGDAARDQRPRGAASKLRRPFEGLLFLLLAAAAASSGFWLAGRKLGGAAIPSPPSVLGEEALGSPPPPDVPLRPSEVPLPSEKDTVWAQQTAPEKAEDELLEQPAAAPGAVAAEAEDEEQSEPDEAGAASRMTAEQEQKSIGWFEEMFVKGPPETLFPIFLRGQEEALELFKDFVANYKTDLEGGEEKDEGARERRRLWTIFKMQMATLANLETITFDQYSQLPMSGGYEEAVREINRKLKEVCRLKVDTAGLWMDLAEEGGLHPDSANDETVLSLLRAQEVHYERALNRLNQVGPRSTPKAANYKGDPRLQYKRLCRGLGEGDQWLMYAMP
ncbi:hypothetical protein Emag_003119 [Eimeria magna]